MARALEVPFMWGYCMHDSLLLSAARYVIHAAMYDAARAQPAAALCLLQDEELLQMLEEQAQEAARSAAGGSDAAAGGPQGSGAAVSEEEAYDSLGISPLEYKRKAAMLLEIISAGRSQAGPGAGSRCTARAGPETGGMMHKPLQAPARSYCASGSCSLVTC